MPATSKAQFRLMKGIANGGIAPRGSLTRAKAAEYVAGESPKGLPERAAKKKKPVTIGGHLAEKAKGKMPTK